jgi:hypothetical protein
MKIAATVLLVSASLLLAGLAEARPLAKPVPLNFQGMIIPTGGSVTVPPEWAGIWTTTDSVYDCNDVLTSTSTGEDTLCAGEIYSAEATGSPIVPDCQGSATATTVHVICTGTGAIGNCQADFTSVLDGVLTADDYRNELTISIVISGSAPECAFIPGFCNRIVTYGHRTGPAPPAYCATPTKATTWGQVKILYR